MTDRPIKSPVPQGDRAEDLDDDEPKTDPSMKIDAGYLSRKLEEVAKLHDRKIRNGGWLMTVVGTIAACGVTVALFVLFVDNRVKAETDAGVAVHESRITALEQQVPQLRQELHEARQDTHDLYKAVMEGKRSERLERPLPPLDGGR